MCSILGSFNKEKIIELCKLNEYRGQHSHSISYFDPKISEMILVKRSKGPVNYNEIDIPKGHYCIVHMQAPTSEDQNSIHPAEIKEINKSWYLWHNGILKPKTIDYLHELYGLKEIKWDTQLLLYHIYKNLFPDDIDGSMACLFYMPFCNLILFRNEISPLYVDKDLNISSTKFENSEMIEHGKMLAMDFKGNQLYYLAPFREVSGPYYFGG